MNIFENVYFSAALAFVLAFVLALLVIPVIINYSHKLNMIDNPAADADEQFRKMHKVPIPTMGGVGIFIGFILSTSLWTILNFNPTIIAMAIGLAVLFAMGIYDDRKNLPPKIKFLFQFAVAIMIAYFGLRIYSLVGLFGVYELPVWVQYAFTVFLVVGLTNAFNLIDGIDGLAGGLAFINSLVLGTLLIINGNLYFSVLAFGFAGALLGFLRFNFNPAKIFMGDTGSLVIGFMMAVLGIAVLMPDAENNTETTNLAGLTIMVFGTMLVPVYDTLRVFLTRILSGKSPFKADKTHVHHILIEIEEESKTLKKKNRSKTTREKWTLPGWIKSHLWNSNHKKAAISLYIADLIIIGMAIVLKQQFFLSLFQKEIAYLGPTLAILILVLLLLILMSKSLFGKGKEIFTKEMEKAIIESEKLAEDNRYLNRNEDEIGLF